MSIVDRSSPLLDQVEAQRKLDARIRGFCIECTHSAMISQLGNSGQLCCRRNPPRLTGIPTAQGVNYVSLYPGVEQNWTCGEFEKA
jgi:hypothetical protein